MASPLRYTLVSDGPTDRALLPIIDWLLLSLSELADWRITACCSGHLPVQNSRHKE